MAVDAALGIKGGIRETALILHTEHILARP